MKIDKNLLERVEQYLLEKAIKHTEHYITDFILDVHKMDRLNNDNKINNTMYFISRDCGTEFGNLSDDRIKYYQEFDCGDNEWYEIDFQGLQNALIKFDNDIYGIDISKYITKMIAERKSIIYNNNNNKIMKGEN